MLGHAPRRWVGAVLGVAAVAAASVGACDDAFTGEGQGGSAGSGAASSTTGTGGSTEAGTATGTSAGTSSGTAAGSATGTTATGTTATGTAGAGGGFPACDHHPCDTGPPLDAACDDCVALVCNSDSPSCCTIGWDSDCVGRVNETCSFVCQLQPAVIGCNDQYGDTPGYVLCDQADGACVFSVADGATCAARCQQAGGRCLSAWSGAARCELDEAVDCNAVPVGGHLSCFCTVGCNGADPCSLGNTVCTNEGCTPY